MLTTEEHRKLFNIHKCTNLINSWKSQSPDKIRVGIIGSRTYENKNKIKDFIFKLKNAYSDKLEIISGGAQYGADKYARKYAIEFGISYVEFNPAFTVKNLYSKMPDSYYEQPYHVTQLFHRNELILRYADYIVAFRSFGKSNGTDHVINNAKKLDKNIVVIDESV